MQPNKIFFHEIQVRSSLLHRKHLKKFLLSIFKNEGIPIKRVDIIFCNDKYLLTLNVNFLNHDYYTDTLSFLLSDSKQSVVGEVYISIDRIRSNAKNYKISYQTELNRVIIHGCLHLCGYLDKPKKAGIEMENIQEKYVSLLNVSRET